MALTDKLVAIADGFRSSRGTTKKYTLDEMATLAAEPINNGSTTTSDGWKASSGWMSSADDYTINFTNITNLTSMSNYKIIFSIINNTGTTAHSIRYEKIDGVVSCSSFERASDTNIGYTGSNLITSSGNTYPSSNFTIKKSAITLANNISYKMNPKCVAIILYKE